MAISHGGKDGIIERGGIMVDGVVYMLIDATVLSIDAKKVLNLGRRTVGCNSYVEVDNFFDWKPSNISLCK
ncbi:hypothetical protein L484_009879 [Morus notabilis]|uniref:Uncharacterized protein n=1 Tax=Morus notabilis TaxID=981085 RepID=W9R798_9ROSA|nr:hypothetical protein L484_009879 [Morus notabilis]